MMFEACKPKLLKYQAVKLLIYLTSSLAIDLNLIQLVLSGLLLIIGWNTD
jgi:hypothetical protein